MKLELSGYSECPASGMQENDENFFKTAYLDSSEALKMVLQPWWVISKETPFWQVQESSCTSTSPNDFASCPPFAGKKSLTYP